MPDLELDNPLRRKQVDAASTTYYLAYRSVLLRPDGPIPAQFYTQFPTTIVIGVAADNQKLIVYAEEIVLLSGSTYSLPGKDLSIHCRSITFCDASPGPVTFDLSGAPSTTQATNGVPPPNAAPASYHLVNESAHWEWDWLGEYSDPNNLKDITLATKGAPGTNGSEGTAGSPGGSFTLVCDVNCKSADIGKYAIAVKTHGGAGSAGGNGSKGGKGGDAVTLIAPESLVPNDPTTDTCSPLAFFSLAPLYQPGAGGSGGLAGSGGIGGNGGDISISFLLNGKVASEEEASKLFVLDASGNLLGPDGTPGAAGDAGDAAKIKLMVQLIDDYTGTNRDRWKTRTDFDVTNSQGNFKLPYIEEQYPVSLEGGDCTVLTIDMAKIQPLGDAPQSGTVAPRTSQAVPKSGNVNLQRVSDLKAVCQGFSNDTRYLAMVLDRLKFEHYLFFTIQPYQSSNGIDPISETKRTELVKAFEESKSWVMQIMQDLDTAGTTVSGSTDLQKLEQKSLESIYSSFQDAIDRGIDVYNNSPNKVPEPSMGISAMEKSNERYSQLEQTLAGISTALSSAETLVEDNRVKLVSTLEQANTELQSQSVLSQKLSDLATQIVAADGVVQTKRLDLESKLINVKQKIAEQVNCGWEDIISALSTVALFYNPEAGVMYAVGAIASGGDSIAKTVKQRGTLPTETGGTVNKDYLYSRITTIGEDATEPLETLTAEFKRAAGGGGKDPGYLSQVRVQESKFNQLCEQYYKIDGVKPAKAAFHDFINAIQTKMDLLDNYNELVIQKATALAQMDNLTAAANALRVTPGADQNQTDALQVANTFLEQTRSAMKQRVLYNLYNVVRTFNCLSLGPSQLVLPLASLQSFVAFDSLTLTANYNTHFLEGDIPRLREMYHTYRRSYEDVTLEVKEKDYPSVFKAMRETGVFTFTLDPDLVCQLGPTSVQENWFDVRFSKVDVFFVGAKCTDKESNIIHHTVTISGSSKFLDMDFKVHKFMLPEVNIGMSYTYDNKSHPHEPLGTANLRPQAHVVQADVYRYELDKGDFIYLQGPMTTWQADITGYHSKEGMKKNPSLVSKVDLDGCSVVRFCFKAVYRSKPRHGK